MIRGSPISEMDESSHVTEGLGAVIRTPIKAMISTGRA